MQTLEKSRRITGEERDTVAAQLTRRYDQGASLRELAELTGRSYGFVHKVLSESGVEFRGRGGPTRGPRKAPEPAKRGRAAGNRPSAAP
ncbi:MAG: helix-turn-helix domain-containing protein [Pseudonocardiaceae bacterium]